jgi:hypothetical protein
VSHEALATQRGGEGLATQKRFNGIVEPGAVRRSMKKLTPWDITYAVNMALACGRRSSERHPKEGALSVFANSDETNNREE